jgi:hypothetical protein
MPKVTIVKDDNKVIVDGVDRTVDCSGESANLHAVQWNGSTGEVEYNDGTPNATIDSISAYQSLIDAHTAAAPVEQSEAEWLAAQTYDVAREAKYGDIGDQLDMQYKDAVNGTSTWKDHIAQVKSDFPKP